MIMLLSPEQPVAQETMTVTALFERGLSRFHIRKYQLTDVEMATYVDGIDRRFRKHLVLQSHFHLASELGIERLHFSEEARKRNKQETFMSGFILSTSVHTIGLFNALSAIWDYAFLSPVFPSISKKGYGMDTTVLDDFRLRCNPHVRLVGLGGIEEQNYKQVFNAGADAIALLGAIWNSTHPIKVFDRINIK